MDGDLQEDLAEALEGVDPLELLANDFPELFPVAEELWNIFQNDDDKCSNDQEPSKDDTKSSNPCVVCQRPAKGYKYFGARVCYGCRAFFARSIKNRTFSNFECAGIECVGKNNWLTCRKCRFDKCLEHGMAVPRRAFHSKTELASRQVQDVNSLSRQKLRSLKLTMTPTFNMTLDEKLNVQALAARTLKKSLKDMITFYATDISVLESTFESFYLGKKFPLAKQKTLQDYFSFVRGREFVEDCELYKFNKLGKKDRARLHSANWPICAEFIDAYRLHKEPVELKMELEALMGALKLVASEEYCKEAERLHENVGIHYSIHRFPCR